MLMQPSPMAETSSDPSILFFTIALLLCRSVRQVDRPPSFEARRILQARRRYRVPVSTRILIDADACPVKEEVYSVASRRRIPVVLVANMPLALPRGVQVRMVVVGRDLDAADDWIAEQTTSADVVITADIPLAARCLERGARVLGTNGRPFTEDSIGNALATRDLKAHLREIGGDTAGPRAMTDRDRSRFLGKLDQLVSEAVKV